MTHRLKALNNVDNPLQSLFSISNAFPLMKHVICFAGEIPRLFLILSLRSMLTDIARRSSDFYHRKGFAHPGLSYIIGTIYNKKYNFQNLQNNKMYNFQNPQNNFHASLARFSMKDIRDSQLDHRHLPLGIHIKPCK